MRSAPPRFRPVLLLICGLLVMAASACNNHYDSNPPIDCNNARIIPEDALVIAGSRVRFRCNRPSDKDTSYSISPITGEVKWDSPILVQDEMADANYWPKWQVTGGSIIGDYEGVTAITWQAPDSATSATIRIADDDRPIPVVPDDQGDRDDTGVDPAASTGVAVAIPEVITVGWQNTHTMFDVDPNKSEWDDSSVQLHYPHYDWNYPDVSPVCMTKYSSARVVEHCYVGQSASFDTTLVIKADSGYLPFGESQATFASGSQYASSSHTSETNTPNEVDLEVVNQHWKYRVPSGSDNWISMNSTFTSLYLTYGTPSGSCITWKRVECVCAAAEGESEPNAIAEAVFWSLTSFTYNLDAPVDGPTPIWLMYDGEQAQCPGVATLLGKHFSMVGMPTWERRFCYALADLYFLDPNHDLNKNAHATYRTSYYNFPETPERTPTRTVGHANPTTHDDRGEPEYLWMVDGDGNRNNYEATCYFGGRYFALIGVNSTIWPNYTEVVADCFNTDWYYFDPNSPNEPDPNVYLGPNWNLYWEECGPPEGRAYPPWS